MTSKNKRTLAVSTIVCIVLSLAAFIISRIDNSNASSYLLLYIISILLNIVLNLALSTKNVSANGAKRLVIYAQSLRVRKIGVCTLLWCQALSSA